MPNSQYQMYSTSQSAWDAMYQAVETATKSIFWELYIFADDEIGHRFFDLLEAKAKAGIDVKLLIDSLGSFWLSKKRIASLRSAGVDVRFFSERKRLRGWWRLLLSRSHRKILVIDEKIGFVGGVNIERQSKDWLDIHLRVEGQVVHSLLRSFAKMYVLSGGPRRRVRRYLAYRYRVATDLKEEREFELMDHQADTRASTLRRGYVKALIRARERIILFSPYYFPDKAFLYELWRARRRGVKIDLLLPLRTDVRIATYAAYGFFAILKKMGVNVRLTKTMMHGKGAVIDDDLAIVGSGNLDQTSFYDNYETTLSIRNKNLVSRLKDTLEEWMKEAVEVDDAWEHRSTFHRMKEWIALRLYRLWHRH